MLGTHVQGLAAGDQETKVRAGLKQLGGHRGSGGDLLEVVEDDEHLPVLESVDELFQWRPVARLVDPDHAAHRRQQCACIACHGQVDEGHTVAELIEPVAYGAHGQACLARAAGPRQGQQPGGWISYAAHDLGQLAFAPDERGGLDGQAGLTAVRGRERREGIGQGWVDELEDALAAAEVLEPELPEIAQARPVGQVVGGQGGSGG